MAVFGSAKESRLRPEEAQALRERVREALAGIVGPSWVTIDPMLLDTYAWQYAAETLSGSNWMPRPLAVVLPSAAEEVAEIVRYANREGLKFKAISTGFGAWGGAGEPDSVIQIDLRRMNRIIEIDSKNMYAVVEPCVTANQLQSEAFKLGLNTHIIGAGAQHSVLASATSVQGQGVDGVSMGFSGRNLLAVEWVTPEGEIVRIGSVDSCGRWFSGDGPGFSLRGVIRGFAGAFGGLGVFTKAAIKLYPWDGPMRLEYFGSNPNYWAQIPENHLVALCVVDSWERLAEFAYRLGEADIATIFMRAAPSLMLGAETPADNNEYARLFRVPLLRKMRYTLAVIITAADPEERDLKAETLKALLRDLKGGMISSIPGKEGARWARRAMRIAARQAGLLGTLRSLPSMLKMARARATRFSVGDARVAASLGMYLNMVRSSANIRAIFRFGGSFWTSLGSLVAIDNAVWGARVGAQVKLKYIRKGVIFDDDADNAWGGLYESGHYAHLEEVAAYDPTDPTCADGVLDFVTETNLAAIDYKCGLPINAIGPAMSALFSPHCHNYDDWQRKIKSALDPRGVSDATSYVDPEYKGDERTSASLARVQADRAPVEMRPKPKSC